MKAPGTILLLSMSLVGLVLVARCWSPLDDSGLGLGSAGATTASESETAKLDQPDMGQPSREDPGRVENTRVSEDQDPVTFGTEADRLPWEEARRTILGHVAFTEFDKNLILKRALGWGRKRDPEFPISTYKTEGAELTVYDEQDLAVLIEEYDEDLQSLGSATVDLLKDAYRDYYGEDRFLRLPLGVEPPERRSRTESKFWTELVVNYGGWTCVLDFRSEDYPILQEHLEQIDGLRSERESAVRNFFAKLK